MKFIIVIIALAGLGYAAYLDQIVKPGLLAQVTELQEKNTDLEKQVDTLKKAVAAANNASNRTTTPPVVQPAAPAAPVASAPSVTTAPSVAAPAPSQASPMPEATAPAVSPESQKEALELQVQELNTQYDLQMAEFRSKKQRLGSEVADMQWKRDSAISAMNDQVAALENNNGSGLRISKADIPRRVAIIKGEVGKKVDSMEFEIKKKTDELSTIDSDRIRYEADIQKKLSDLRAQIRAL